ncbi:MAG: Na+/H+ antiporter subunit E [Spirochaetota bacterium]
MQRVLDNVGFVLLLSIVWFILNESLDFTVLISGPIIAATALYVTNRLVLKSDYHKRYHVRFVPLLFYCGVLLKEIYVAGFHAMVKIVTGRINVNIVEFDTRLTNDFHIALLANSITLTPGTVTMEKDGRHLTVIWIDAHTTDPSVAAREIMGSFEQMLLSSEGSNLPAGGGMQEPPQ